MRITITLLGFIPLFELDMRKGEDDVLDQAQAILVQMHNIARSPLSSFIQMRRRASLN